MTATAQPASTTATFQATQPIQVLNPRDLTSVEAPITPTTTAEIDLMVNSGLKAGRQLLLDPKLNSKLIAFGNRLVEQLGARADEIVAIATQETPYPDARIKSELGRATFTIKEHIRMVQDGTIRPQPEIETGEASRFPNENAPPPFDKLGEQVLSRDFMPVRLGVDFGSSNFPVAFGPIGNNPIAALFAGSPMIYKAHPLNANTSNLLAEIVQESLTHAGLSTDLYQIVQGGHAEGEYLVGKQEIDVITFTGSKQGALGLNNAKHPGAVLYAECGAVNPQIIFQNAAAESTWEDIATAQVGSACLGGGQFCTQNGMLIVDSTADYDQLKQKIGGQIKTQDCPVMLCHDMAEKYRAWIEKAKSLGATVVESDDSPNATGTSVKPALVEVDLATLLANPELQEENFGPSMLIVKVDLDEMESLLDTLGGQLAISMWGTHQDEGQQAYLKLVCKQNTGRLIADAVPTGVIVSALMNHGGPFPATVGPDVTSVSVGPETVRRFQRRSLEQNFIAVAGA